MSEKYKRKLLLPDGSEYYGYGFGDTGDAVCELVFNTSMVGYQEILSDPSYTYQAVVMTYPLIGNYGICDDDFECERPTVGALIVREYNEEPSNFRSAATLGATMEKYHIPGIWGVDTRKLTRYIRNEGSCKVLLTDADTPTEKGIEILASAEIPTDAVSEVSRKKICRYNAENEKYHVVAIDCGMKQNIIRSLNKRNCSVTVVPYDTDAEYIRELKPDGVFISNGPGDPEDVQSTISTVRSLIGLYPVFGICLGHQIISLAYGAKTYKLKFGHRGGNHPVKNLQNEKIEITSQNHSYAVDKASLENTPLEITHINILDGTVEGVECKADRVFSVQYHPESAPGPEDSGYLFDKLISMMEGDGNA